MNRLLCAALGAAIALGFTQPAGNNDLGFHLRIGAHILDGGGIPSRDLWSSTARGTPFVDQEWLSQALLAATERAGGTKALSAAAAVCVAGTAVLLLGAMPGGLPAGTAVLLLISPLLAGHFHARPHVLGWLLLAGFVLSLRRGPAWLPYALLALWANCHASFLLGVGLGGLHFLERRRPLAALAFLLPPLLNPRGWDLYRFFLELHDIPLGLIEEFKPMPFASPRFILWTALLVLLGLGIARERRLRPWELCGIGVLAWAGFRSMRYPPVCAIALAPLLAELWASRFPGGRGPRLLLCGLLLAGAGYQVLARDAARAGAREEPLPVRATAFLLSTPVEGPLFNDYNFGGYLLWKAWPRFPVCIDGRMDVYRDFLKDYRAAITGESWEAPLARFRVVLVKSDRRLVRALDSDPAWEPVYFDHVAAVFLRTGEFPSVRRLVHVTPTRSPLRPGTPEELRARIEELEYLLRLSPRFRQGSDMIRELRRLADASR